MAPQQKPGKSKQDYCTPKEFLEAVKNRLGIEEFDIDLAASKENRVCPRFYDEEVNSLEQPWKVGEGWAWLNPPFGNIAPWVSKAVIESTVEGAKIAMLLPAGVGSNWWKTNVHNIAHVLLLNGRISFDGIAPYPKDCVLLLWTPFIKGGYDVWSWNGKMEVRDDQKS